MTDIRRVFVEKKPGFDVEAQHMLEDFRLNLGLSLSGLRVFNRYDIEGISDEEFAQARNTIFSEPPVDEVYDEEMPLKEGWQVFAMEYLPGQYDQRADSAAQCVQLLTQKKPPLIATAKVVAVLGLQNQNELDKIIKYCLNSIESRLASLTKPSSLALNLAAPGPIPLVEGFTKMKNNELLELAKKAGFAMSEADMVCCQEYFGKTEKREPTFTELKVIDTYWSDHCRHTTFHTHLNNITLADGPMTEAIKDGLMHYEEARHHIYGDKAAKRPMTLMDIATLGGKFCRSKGWLDDLDDSGESNACSIVKDIEIDGQKEEWLIQFKNETHNHPTEIEPFGGAATCLGGAIRDVLAGRGYVYQAMRVTGSGNPLTPYEETLPGKLPQRTITTGAAKGFSSYGNQIGLATGWVEEIYDPGYVAKRMEIGAVVGACPASYVQRAEPTPGDAIILLGGRTGRDGIGGATGSSLAHDVSSIEECGSQVQKGNPPTERKIQRLFRDAAATSLIKRCNDFGAGGVSVAIGELADGVDVDLDKVPKKYEGLDGTELAISESQERMAIVVAPENVDKFIALAEAENLEATAVARVTKEPRIILRWRGDIIVNIARSFLDTNGADRFASVFVEAPNQKENHRQKKPAALVGLGLKEAWQKNLTRLEVCSQKGLVECFDSSIGAGTVLMPFAGKYQQTPENAMVAKVPLLKGETDDATVMSFGYLPGLAHWSPYHAGAYSIVEALAKLAATGADALSARLSLQEYFPSLGNDAVKWGKPFAALLGALTAQMELGVPAIGGKDSMSGSFEDLAVPSTIVCFALTMTKASKAISAALDKPGQKLAMLSLPVKKSNGLPNWPEVKKYFAAISRLAAGGQIQAAATIKEGGIAAALTKMCLGNQIGFQMQQKPKEFYEELLFTPLVGSLLVAVEDVTVLNDLPYTVLGETTKENYILVEEEKLYLKDLTKTYNSTLELVFPQVTPHLSPFYLGEGINKLYKKRSTAFPGIKVAKPRVLIPVFPGTNCEYDTAKAFEKAGAVPEIVVIKNLTSLVIEETIARLVKSLKQSQILALPGGFSGGDEPDGAGKFIATTFRNPRLAQAVKELLEERDGLVLGICNGFQALIKLGLVPHGKICPIEPNAATLTYNSIGHHVSAMAYTKVVSVKSPWLANCEAGEVFTVPISHGEGRFMASDDILQSLAANGQIATQYVNTEGCPSNSSPYNPNGSVYAIEGIISPDGRVFGKMCHSERQGENVYRNVPGKKDQKIFAAGVAYFA